MCRFLEIIVPNPTTWLLQATHAMREARYLHGMPGVARVRVRHTASSARGKAVRERGLGWRPLLTVLMVVAASGGAYAQAASASATPPVVPSAAVHGKFVEIVLTAQKRHETLCSVPENVAVLSGAQLQARQIAPFEDVTRAAPGVSFAAGGGPSLDTSKSASSARPRAMPLSAFIWMRCRSPSLTHTMGRLSRHSSIWREWKCCATCKDCYSVQAPWAACCGSSATRPCSTVLAAIRLPHCPERDAAASMNEETVVNMPLIPANSRCLSASHRRMTAAGSARSAPTCSKALFQRNNFFLSEGSSS